MQIQMHGLVWYEADSYDEARALMLDGSRLPHSFAEWERKAKQVEQRMALDGQRCVRVVIRPVEFKAWCLANGKDVDARGRTAFASFIAMQRQQDRQ